MRSFSSLSANSPINSVWILTDDDPSGEMSPAQYAAYVQPIMQAQLNIALADEAAGV